MMCILASGQIVMGQFQNQWPTPIVALYDCDLSGATISSVSAGDTLSTVSSKIFKLVSEDASSGGVILMSLGSGDTSSNEIVTRTWPTVFTPDSTADHDVDYVISSNVTGTPGSYTISIFLQNSYTLQHAAEGTATFAAATDSSLNAAVETALSTMLPLSSRIRAYEVGLRNASQTISINPKIFVAASKPSIPAKGSTAITITVLDCDSTPLAGRQLELTSVGGSVAQESVTTGGDGRASVNFNAGSQDIIGYVQASLSNQTTVTDRPIIAGGSGVVVVGSPDLSYKWKLDFNFSYLSRSYSDTLATGDFGTSWGQTGGVTVATAFGSAIIDMNVYDGGFSYDIDSVLWAVSKKFSHSLSKTSNISNDENCPPDPWEMKGSTENGTSLNDSVTIPTTLYLSTGGNVSYETLISQSYNGGSSYYDWKRGNTSDGQGGCQTQSSYQTGNLNVVAPLLGVYTQTMAGTSIVFDGPPSNPNAITVAIGYDSSTVTYDIGAGAVNTYNSLTYQAYMQPVSNLINGVHGAGTDIPKVFSLSQNFPNPFNPTTEITYQLPAASEVTLKVFDILGREVATLVKGRQGAGSHSVIFSGTALGSGVYFFRLVAGNFTATKKMALLK